MGQLAVYTSPLPFSNKQVKTEVPYGSDIHGIVNAVVPYDLASVGVIAIIDGKVLTKDQWNTVPAFGAVVNIRVMPQGGGGGGKNPLATVLSIAVSIAAPYLSAAILGPGIIAGSQLGAALLSKGLTAAIGIVGKLAVSSLASPPKQTNAGKKSINNAATSPTQFIEGASNTISPFGVIPICLGTNRMFPLQAARPFTETQDDKQYARQLFTWGWGDSMTLSEIKIGDTLLTQFTDYDIAHKLDGDLHDGTSLYSDDIYQNDFSILLDNDDGYTLRTTQPNVDEAIIDITFPQGLYAINSKGKRVSATVACTVQYSPTGAGTWTTTSGFSLTSSQNEALRKSLRITFPSNGTYDVRIKRDTADATVDTQFDKVYLTALKSITHVSPVNLQGICGTAIRIKATEQLNGVLDQFNAIVTNEILDYDAGGSPEWIVRATSNPASLYRYVLQGAANARPISDSKIDIAALEVWHSYCEAKGYTYNRVIDYEASVDDILRDIASAGAASPAIVDGKRTIVIDNEKTDIVAMVTPRNSWGYSGELQYATLPHAFRVQFRNANKGYVQDERIVYDDGYDENNATEFETLEFQSCTNSDMAFKMGRRHIAAARLRPEVHTFSMDVENIVFLRGDRIKFINDAPIIGVGDGRIKTVTTDNGSPELVTGFTIDDTVTIPSASTYYVRIRLADGTQIYKELVTSVGSFSAFTFATPFTIADTPAAGDLCYFVETGMEKDLIVLSIEPGDDLTAVIRAIDYAPGIFTASEAAIPSWTSNITTPLEFIRPEPPVLVNAQSGEAVMIINSDGSYTSRAVFALQNPNEQDVLTQVKVRVSGSDVFTNANVLQSTPESLIISGLQDDTYYDIHIRYQRPGSNILSALLELNSYLFEGAAGSPDDVTNFRITVTGTSAFFSWDANDDIDLSHYKLKFSSLFTGATWETAQTSEETIYDNRIAKPFQAGTYLIKAVDQYGNESDNAVSIVTYDPGLLGNAVQVIDEAGSSPFFAGTKTNVDVFEDGLVLIDETTDGYYYFATEVDLEGIYQSSVSAAITATGIQLDPMAANDVFDMTDIFDVEDIFGLTAGSWAVTLEYRYTTDNPAASPVTWTAWSELIAGNIEFWGMQFRLKLISYELNISPKVTGLTVTVDMPDRIERGEDLTVTGSGATITYSPPFKAPPAVGITIQDGATDDRIEFTSKDSDGFTFKVYNATSAGYVTRTYDYIASGYGRDNT